MFKLLEYAYAQDQYARFHGSKQLPIQDPASYAIIGGGYTKDKRHVYKGTPSFPARIPLHSK